MSPFHTALFALAIILLGGILVVMSALALSMDGISGRCHDYFTAVDRLSADVLIFENFPNDPDADEWSHVLWAADSDSVMELGRLMDAWDKAGLPAMYLEDKSTSNALWIAFMELRRATADFHKAIYALHCRNVSG